MYKLIMKNEYATFEQLFVSEIDLMQKIQDLKGIFNTYTIEITKQESL